MNRKEDDSLVIYDVIRQEAKDSEGSIWKGDKGIYIIRHIEGKPKGRKKMPLAKVILNHQFLTGLFESKRRGIYTGDVKEGNRRRFLLFRVLNAKQMEIHIQS